MRSAPADGVHICVAQDSLSPARKPPSAATVGASAAERERRIRLEATKRRRAQVLRAKLSEESKEKRYQHALSKRQHVQQEYVRSARKQFRSWRKQVIPALHPAATDGATRGQELPAGRAHHSKASWDEDARGRDPTPSKPAVAMSQLKIDIGSGTVVEGGDAPSPGKTLGEQSRGERWANLPPELRAIKDRWLGESSEEIMLPSAVSNVNISTCAVASTPTHGDQQDQGERPEADLQDKNHRLENWSAPAGETAGYGEGGSGAAGKGLFPGEPAGEKEEWRQGRRESSGDGRGVSAENGAERSPVRRNLIRDTPNTEDRDMLRTAQPPEADEQRCRYQHPSPVVESTVAHRGVRRSRPGRDTSSPRLGGGPPARASGPQEGRASGSGELAQNTAVPGTREGLGVALAPAFGGALEAQEDTHRREKVRNQLRALRSRLPRSSTGDIPPAVSPTLFPGDNGSVPSPREEDPADARVRPPSTTRAQIAVDETEAAGQGLTERQSSDDRAGASDGDMAGRRLATPAAVPPQVKLHEAPGQTASGKQQPHDGALLENGERAGAERKLQSVANVRDDVAVAVEGVPPGHRGGDSTSETPSTASRQSELFDSLDLSASFPRNGGVLATGGPGAAQPAPATVAATYQRPLSQTANGLERGKFPNGAVVATAAQTLEMQPPSSSQDGSVDRADPSVEAIAPALKIQPKQASQRAPTKLLLPEKAPESLPTAPRTTTKAKPGGQSNNETWEAPCVSRLRAPGWGREAKITAIPPASTAVGGADAGTPHDDDAAPTEAGLLPWDLLTPVTEAATVDEHSAVSRSTRGTARMTPASSDVSGSRPDQGEALGAARGRIHHQSPRFLRSKTHHHAAPGPAAGGLEPPLESSGAGIGHGREKRAMWGSGVVGSGAHSAPGKSTARPKAKSSPSGGALSSQSGYRSSPLSGAGDRVGARGSTFSSASEDVRPGRQAGGGGYVAAMGRRARSRARCEAARRLAAAALAAKRARPSTPISERTRWGKGRESQVEVERRQLLQRRAEYAEELKRKAKEDAEALAHRKLVTTGPAMLPADPRHVRALALEHGSGPSCGPDVRAGAHKGNVSRAIDSKTNHDRARSGGSVDGRDKGPHLVHDCSALSPAVSPTGGGRGGQGIGSAERSTGASGGGRQRGVARRRQKPERQAACNRPSAVEREEEEARLMASIARLDTLLREESGDDAVAKASSKIPDSPRGRADVRADPLKSGRGMERKPVREPVGAIAKSRVRKGGGKETKTCGSLAVAPTTVPKVGPSHGASAPAVNGVANEHAASAVPSGPGLFPPLFSRVPPCLGERRERGRYAPPDADEMRANSPIVETVASRMPASHVPGTRHHDTGREQRWMRRRDGDGSGEAMPVQYHRPHDNSRQAVLPRRVVDSSVGGSDIPRDIGTSRRQVESVQRTPYSPGRRHRDTRYGDSSGGWHGYSGGGHEYYGERIAAADPRDAWDVRAGGGDWTGEPHPDDQRAYGRCSATREWDRREDGGQYLPTHAARW